MAKEGKPAMEKIIGETDIKGLEEEIDSAVDRLFVEKKKNGGESLSMEAPISGPSYETLKASGEESSFHPSPEPLPFMKSLEKMETQLLSLEWEITKENLEKTKDEVLALRMTLKEKPDITSVLNLMEKALIHMIKNEENIQPPQVKFLLDSKETIKLLMKKETEKDINIYKQLAIGGIEARFLCLEGLKELKTKQLSSGPVEKREKTEIPKTWEQQIERVVNEMRLFSEKLDDILKRFEQHLSRFGQMARTSPKELVGKRLLPMDITIFKIDEKLFGIQSDNISKLFKVPSTFQDRISSQQRIRLKDFEIQMVDLGKIFSIQSRSQKGEIQILIVKGNGEYKGLIIDQVLKKLSTEADVSEEYGEYFLGMVHWTYQEKPVDIPILNLKKI
jgi:hypothetical protein